MFPSMNNSSYPFYYNQSPSFTTSTDQTNNISFQHQQELCSNNYIMPSNIIPMISENSINTLLLEGHQINNLGNNGINESSLLSNINKQVFSSSKRAVGKRDRHTKICTAQGVRDRRVRLSISIAREFFSLQDILGFDKASKTLGWLLEKSKAAIEELTSTANRANYNEMAKGLFSNSDTNLIDAQNIEENGEDEDGDCDEEKGLTSSRRQAKKEHCNDQSVEKAIRRTRRAKARDRARERTTNKKTINNNHNNQLLESSSDQQQRGAEQNVMFRQSISDSIITPPPTHGGMSKRVSVGESVVVKSKSKELPSLNYNYDTMMKDYQMIYNDNDLNNNNGGMIIQPSAGLSALNIINLSTEIHINAKPWDTNYNNQNLL